METEKFDSVLIDGEHPGHVVQDGAGRSLVSTRRSDGEPGEQHEWYDNARLTVIRRRESRLHGDEPESVEVVRGI